MSNVAEGGLTADMKGLIPRTAAGPDISIDELQLAVRNHSMPLEALHYDVTPVGMHYLLIHWDIPRVDVGSSRLNIGGSVNRNLALALEDLKALPR
jgi:sulfane dehydrogenase subunit SoxC